MRISALLILFASACQQPSAPAAPPPGPPPPTGSPSVRVNAAYEPKLEDPIIKEMKDENNARDEARDTNTEAIRALQKAADDKEEREQVALVAPPPAGAPESPAQFEQVFHFEPQPQFLTGTCWSFAATSFLESEVQRVADKKIKLSEIYAVYHEYLEKVRRFVRERGDSYVAQGAELNSVMRMWKRYGAVPQAAYPGVVGKDGRHNHSRLMREIRGFLKHVKTSDMWDEERVLAHVRVILDAHLGRPPQSFIYQGSEYTPSSFLTDVLTVDPADYVQLMSTMKQPFWKQGELEVPDNWWKDATYYNVPLDDFAAAIEGSVRKGFGVGIGGDVSEPGKVYRADLAYIPSFDIPPEYIDQSARELRIANGATTDDHGIHLVGWSEIGGSTWYLIKDSGRSSRHGKHRGYYFFRKDYIQLKMLAAMMHRDAVSELLARFQPSE